ncbi:hypothetical protein [uncultured Methanobrevibacter sp.]|nr:hypothetical protein [uncultured Methanobrevibacter sp.]
MRKHTDVLNPSMEDKKLILFSKDKECPVISNDLKSYTSIQKIS